jgi:arylsulfatase A-like enzyme
MQGRSWKPLLTGATTGAATSLQESFYYEYFLDPKFPKETPCQALRTPTAKLIIYPGHEEWTELFDLKNDPHETRNLVNDPEYATLLAQMKTEFITQQQLASGKK